VTITATAGEYVGLTFTGSSVLTIPTTGTAALLGTANAFTANNTFGGVAGTRILTVSSTDGLALEYISGAAGFQRSIFFRTAGVHRWELRCNTVAESGSNAGSDFNIIAHTDAGAAIGSALILTRATLNAAFGAAVTTVGGVHVGGTSDPGTDNLLVDGTLTSAYAIHTVADGNISLRIAGATGRTKIYGYYSATYGTVCQAWNTAEDALIPLTFQGSVILVPSSGLHVGGSSDPGNDNLLVDGTFGCNAATAQAAYIVGAAAPAGGTGATAGAYDTAAHRDSMITLVNNMRTALINNGIAVAA
jgi:hypothetical protein